MENEKRLIWDEDAQHRIVALAVKRGSDYIPLDMITHILFNESPTVDAVEVVHGRWIFVNSRCGCSECRKCLSYDGNGVILDLSNLPYCPHCGAKMDGERKDND